MADLPRKVDVVIVGAGPAGLSAAAELCAAGVGQVLVLERATEAGGIPRICAHSPYGMREFRRLLFGPAYARALQERASRRGAQIVTGAAVVSLGPGPHVKVTTDTYGMSEVSARAILLATGTREMARPGRMIGGTKPGGVMVTGALQYLVYKGHRRPFLQPAILGTELVSFSAIATCLHAGIRPRAMIEPGSRITTRRPAGAFPRLLGIPLLVDTEVVAVEGTTQVAGLIVRTGQREYRLDADGLITSGRFRPEAHLAHLGGLEVDPQTGGPAVDEGGRTSQPGVYAAGNLLRPVETAGWCWQEGRAVAHVIAADLQHTPEPARARVSLEGDALKYVVPQRISGNSVRAFDVFQTRVGRPVRGRFGVTSDCVDVASRHVSSLPERRLTLPIPTNPEGSIKVYLTEKA